MSELEKVNKNELSTELKMSEADREQMFGGLESEDITVPRVVILQGLSPEVSEGKGSPGQLYVKGFERNLGKEPLEFLVIMRSKSRLRWRDLKLGGGISCQSSDAKIGQGDPGGECEKCPCALWGARDEQGKQGKPDCDLYQNVIIVLRKDEDWIPMALSGNRTKLKAMKNLNSLLMMEMQKGRPVFSKSYLLEPTQKQNQGGINYFSYRISTGNNNAVLPEEDIKRAYGIFNSLKGKKLNIVEDEREQRQEAAIRDDI